MSRNEAAERLLNLVDVYVKPASRPHMRQGVREALATERRLTVERVRETLTDTIEQAIFETGTGLEAAMLASERILDDLATANVDEEAGK